MKTFLAVGDSLVTGDFGCSFLGESACLKGFEAVNRGQNGEPLKGILRNLKVHLGNREAPEVLLLDGGANDLLIPYMEARHPAAWAPFFRKLARHGSLPIQEEEPFRRVFRSLLETALEASVSHILVTTIPCLGENLATPLNQDRRRLNRCIREEAEGLGRPEVLRLLDLGRVFEEALAPSQPGSDWLFSSPGDMGDPPRGERAEERGLLWTADGVHLNRRGAALAARSLDAVLSTLCAGKAREEEL